MSKAGRPRNELRDLYAKKYGLTPGKIRKMRWPLFEQLERCKTESARKLILGIKE